MHYKLKKKKTRLTWAEICILVVIQSMEQKLFFFHLLNIWSYLAHTCQIIRRQTYFSYISNKIKPKNIKKVGKVETNFFPFCFFKSGFFFFLMKRTNYKICCYKLQLQFLWHLSIVNEKIFFLFFFLRFQNKFNKRKTFLITW